MRINANHDAMTSYAISKSDPFFSIGRRVESEMTAQEAIQFGGCDFSVAERDLYYFNQEMFDSWLHNGNALTPMEVRQMMTKVSTHKATVRTDNNLNLGVVGSGYQIVQNKGCFDFVDLLTSGEMGHKANFEVVGCLEQGKRIFMTCKFDDVIKVNNNDNDPIEMYCVFTTSHDGSGAIACCISPIRCWCNNMLNSVFKRADNKIYFKHTKNVGGKMDIVANRSIVEKLLKGMDDYKTNLTQALDKMATIRLNDKQIENAIVKSVLGEKIWTEYASHDFNLNAVNEEGKTFLSTRSINIVNDITASCHNGIGQDVLESGTALWVMNGITTYYQNEYDWGKNGNERKFDAILDGSVQNKVQAFTDFALAM